MQLDKNYHTPKVNDNQNFYKGPKKRHPPGLSVDKALAGKGAAAVTIFLQ
jgi:hypothetical protein